MSAYLRAPSLCTLCLVSCASVSLCFLEPRIMHSVPVLCSVEREAAPPAYSRGVVALVSWCFLEPRIMHSVPAVVFCCLRGGASCVLAVCRRSCVRECFMCVPRASHVSFLFVLSVCVRVHCVLVHKSFDLRIADRTVRYGPRANALLPFGSSLFVRFTNNFPRPPAPTCG